MTKTLSLGSRLSYPITISKLLKSPGDELKKREPLFEYKYTYTREVGDSFRDNTWTAQQSHIASWTSPTEGKLKEWHLKEGATITRDGPCLVVEETCSHDIQFQGLCAMCGKDMTEVDWASEQPDSSRATIKMTHDNTGLTVSSSFAARSEHDAQKRLLEQRKLSLVVDLDQTIIHACIEPTIGEWQSDPSNPNHDAVKDVKSFQLNDDGPRGLATGCWYYIKMRPGLAKFLEAMSNMYEMHVYTMGTRAYALNIAKLIDPDMKYFGHRVISRDENGNLVSKNLRRLFPVSTDMVVIIDDRSDVWPGNRPNLIKVTPYDFFKGIGDINSSFLPRRQDIVTAPPPRPPNGTAPISAAKPASANDSSSKPSAIDELVKMSSGQDKRLQLQQTAEQAKSLEKQITDRPLLHMQEELDKEDGVDANSETSNDVTQHQETPPERHHILRDDDDELVHIQQHLTDLHSTFYKLYDERNTTGGVSLSAVPDAGYLLDELKGNILRGVVMVLSGLVPLGVDVLGSELGLQIMSFGADLQTRVTKNVTHLVVSTQRPRTEKLRIAAKIPSIKIVNQYWLADCLSQWKKLDEEPYLVKVNQQDRKITTGQDGKEVISDADDDENDGSLKIIDESKGLEYGDDDEGDDGDGDGDGGLVLDLDSVMPHEVSGDGQSPIDDLKEFDWEGVDDELAEFLGSDAEDSDEDEDEEGESGESTSGTKRRAEDEGDDGADAKRQKMTNGGGGGGEEVAVEEDDFAGDLEADLLAELEAQENG